MNFIGNNCEFNNVLRDKLTVGDYTVVSNVGEDYTDRIEGNKVIILFPINSEKDYVKYMGEGYLRIIESGFTDSLKTYTSIFLYMIESIDVMDVVSVINNFDKDNLVDNMFIYPKLENCQLRDNNVENLPWQKINRDIQLG